MPQAYNVPSHHDHKEVASEFDQDGGPPVATLKVKIHDSEVRRVEVLRCRDVDLTLVLVLCRQVVPEITEKEGCWFSQRIEVARQALFAK